MPFYPCTSRAQNTVFSTPLSLRSCATYQSRHLASRKRRQRPTSLFLLARTTSTWRVPRLICLKSQSNSSQSDFGLTLFKARISARLLRSWCKPNNAKSAPMKSSSCHMQLEERSSLVQDEVEWNALEHEASPDSFFKGTIEQVLRNSRLSCRHDFLATISVLLTLSFQIAFVASPASAHDLAIGQWSQAGGSWPACSSNNLVLIPVQIF